MSPKWSLIKGLSNTKLVASTSLWVFLSPIIVKLGVNDGFLLGDVVFSGYSIYFLYFSAVSFFLGFFLYCLFCPPVVKEFESYAQFSDKGMTVDGLSSLVSQMGRSYSNSLFLVLEQKVGRATPEEIDGAVAETVSIGSEPKNFTFHRGRLNSVFWCVHDFSDGVGLIPWLFCLLFYVTGFLFLAILMGMNFFLVLEGFLSL